MLTLTFTKHDSQSGAIQATRSDGSSTYANQHTFMIIHDLYHYAVETVLKLEGGFYGFLEAGIDITTFEGPRDQRPPMEREGIMIEHLVNLLTTELNSGRQDDFLKQLQMILDKDELAFPESLTEETLEEIRQRAAELTRQWQTLHDKGKMVLEF